MRNTLPLGLLFLLVGSIGTVLADPSYQDRTFDSKVFGSARYYRIFLPAGYESAADESPDGAVQDKRYPVIYYFHGHSDRYTLERYDDGEDTVPKIARFVAEHDVIVVAMDGYVKEHYEGFYGGTPWDLRESGGEYDFGNYFQEMVAHIDGHYRTRTGRRFRATSGLSMGGFMSLWLSARYPQGIGSASAFNPAPELFVGDEGSRMLWRPKDHVRCHGATRVRLIRASGDYISQYTEETRDAYARAEEVEFEYRQDEYHRHWATSIDETFAFHWRAFANPSLNEVPSRWSYSSPYRQFSAWDYAVRVEGEGKILVSLTDVQDNGFQLTTRRWAPDGPPATSSGPPATSSGPPATSSGPPATSSGPPATSRIQVVTAARYRSGASYQVAALDLTTENIVWSEVRADSEGRLTLRTDGAGYHLSVIGPDVAPPNVVLLPLTARDRLRLQANTIESLPIRVYNPGRESLRQVRAELSSKCSTVEWVDRAMTVPELGSGEVAAADPPIQLRLVAGRGDFTPLRLTVDVTAEGQRPQSIPLDVLVIPDHVPRPIDVEILDGRTVTFSVFRQKGNQGGGQAIERTVTEGKGNGDGRLQPGEEVTVWVKIPQGLDPLDKNNWHRTKIFFDSPWLRECEDIQEQKQREWTGAMDRTSVVRLADDAAPGAVLPVLLDNESWSFHYTPEVRYGREPLYQAFQRHRHHLHRWELKVAGPK